MAATRRRAELGLTLLALALYAGIGAQWAVAQRPWGSYTWARSLPVWVAGMLPWLILGWLALRRHRHAPWLALGACAASLPCGVSRCPTFVWAPLYGGPALHRLALFAPVLAALSLVAAQQLRRERVHWRGRVSRVACGALLVWIPLYLYLAVHSFFWDESWLARAGRVAGAPPGRRRADGDAPRQDVEPRRDGRRGAARAPRRRAGGSPLVRRSARSPLRVRLGARARRGGRGPRRRAVAPPRVAFLETAAQPASVKTGR